MRGKIDWNFYKVILQLDESFKKRQEVMKVRFDNADTYVRPYGDTQYKYQLYDVESKIVKSKYSIVFGRLIRSPKIAHGRKLQESKRISSDTSVNIQEIADATEFIYEFDSCVLALHRRYPFYANSSTANALRSLLGIPFDPKSPKNVDVHVEIMRDEEFSEDLFDSPDPLKEVRLLFAKPNPGSGDGILEKIHLGLIGEDTLSDEIIFDAKKKTKGSLDKKGFLRRSVTALLGQGYLKSGHMIIADKRVDLLKAAEKTCETDSYKKDEMNKPVGLPIDVDEWLKQLKENKDIYPDKKDAREQS